MILKYNLLYNNKAGNELEDFMNKNNDISLPQEIPEKAKEYTKSIREMMIAQAVKKDRALDEVVPGLYIGSIASVIFSKALNAVAITHIITTIKNINILHVDLLAIIGLDKNNKNTIIG